MKSSRKRRSPAPGGPLPGNPRKSAPAFARSYRRASSHEGETSFQVVSGQTDLWITAAAHRAADLPALALDTVNRLRAQVSSWILIMPEFASSLSPVPIPDHAPEIVRRMGEAGRLMNVGPMAAVAGAIAAMTAEALLERSPEIIVENGGDMVLYSRRERVVGILSRPGQKTMLGVRVKGREGPVSLCASSATMGHSLSLGSGDVTVVRSRDACLADAAATAFGNLLKTDADVQRAADLAASFAPQGIEGFFALCQGTIGVWGDMELVPGALP